MTAAATSPGSPLDTDGRLAGNIPCRRCGYDLHGLRPDAHCPECGQSIADSLRSDLLAFADPAWLARIAAGVRWLLVYAALVAALTAGARPLFSLLHWFRSFSIVIPDSPVILALTSLWLVAAGVGGLAVRDLTAADPVHPGVGAIRRRIARACVLAAIVIQAIHYGLFVADTFGPWSGQQINAPRLLTGTVAYALAPAWQTALLFTLALWATRLPGPSLARHFKVAAAGVAVVGAIAAALSMAQLAFILNWVPTGKHPFMSPWWQFIFTAGNAMSFAYALLLLWALVLVYRFHRRLREARGGAASGRGTARLG